ncbi:PCRF domain-containing protein [Chitinimonas arctica]|uniref:PCRF domain-containing protein n=1 Tax=Chitinimonas arctica TaxID=2594795 RepID=UPI001CC7CC47|nr:PCRF domain-containing protein [Chitinimonas arctica]
MKSYWRKESLRKFLRASNVSEAIISAWNSDESKRDFLDRIFQKHQITDSGKTVIYGMAQSLSEQATFPDLRNWEDSAQKISEATKAVAELKSYLKAQDEEIRSEREREQAKAKAQEERQTIQRTLTDKAKLQQRLESLHLKVGTQQGGYEFQDWFFDLLEFCEIQNRRPYVSAGRQIDGSLTHDGTTYLIELKFTGSQSSATDIDSIRAKVDDKADNTMGIILSISGFSSVAIAQASGRKTTLLLFDAMHLYLFLSGTLSFGEIISRIRRHVSQTGEAYLPVANFSG